MSNVDEIQTAPIVSAYDYSRKVAVLPSYRFTEIIQSNGSASIAPASRSKTSWNLPAGVYNLSRSYLKLDFISPAVGARISSVFTVLPVATTSLKSLGGQSSILYRNDYSNYYVEMTRLLTPLSEWRSRSYHVGAGALLSDVKAGSLANPAPKANIIPAPNSEAQLAGLCFDEADAEIEPTDPDAPQNLTTGDTVNTAQALQAIFPLSQLGGVFALDKSLPWGEMLLEMDFLPASEWGYTSTTPADVDVGYAAFAAAPTVSSRSVYLAMEQNAAVSDGLNEQVASEGLNVVCNYIESARADSVGGAGNTNITIPLAESAGALHSVIAAFYTQQGGARLYRRTAGAAITSLTSRLNAQLLHDKENYGFTDSSFYSEMRLNFEDTPQGNMWLSSIYPLWADNFYGGSLKTLNGESSGAMGGLSLPRGQASQYTLKFVAAAACNVISFATVKKMLKFRNGSVSIESAYLEN
jgi:hypothetical protein